MTLSNPASKEVMALAWTGVALYISLHSADPGTTGANEITSVGRKLITWTGGSVDGNVTGTIASGFALASGTAAPWAGYWSANSGGVFYEKVAVNVPAVHATPVMVDPSISVA